MSPFTVELKCDRLALVKSYNKFLGFRPSIWRRMTTDFWQQDSLSQNHVVLGYKLCLGSNLGSFLYAMHILSLFLVPTPFRVH